MKKQSSKRDRETCAFNVPPKFRKIWNGTLFGKRKDKIILRILSLGGKTELESKFGISLNGDMVAPIRAPTLKALLSTLRKVELRRKEFEQGQAAAAWEIANRSEHYIKENTVLLNSDNLHCVSEIWTPKSNTQKGHK